ncbi:MAG: repair protein RecN [Gammaproteobacteria bacterium]|nr:repair protein RecN [Gammaproteobacteria bacterium]
MLIQIHISNLITIHELDVEFQAGTTVITGETGAGKSILIDAILLVLGSRATGDLVRPGQEKADISLIFDISRLSEARQWLKDHDLHQAEECILRRTIYSDGRSRSYINGTPSTLQPLRELSEFLIQIHGQHEHQSLLKTDKQRTLLDRYAGHADLVDHVQTLAEEWQKLTQELAVLRQRVEERTSRGDFLKFQLQELEELQLQQNEFIALDVEHKKLAHASELLKNINLTLGFLTDQEEQNALHALYQAMQALEKVHQVDPKISTWIESLHATILQLKDIEDELRRYLDTFALDPERLSWLDQRISLLFDIARKHKIDPNELYDMQQKLISEYNELEYSDTRFMELEKKLNTLTKFYYAAADKLSQSRKQAAKKLIDELTKIIRELSLPHAEFNIHFENTELGVITGYGIDKIIFQIKTNDGQPLQPLAKIVSGGELSRIALAIYMTTALKYATPTLIFDEIDVGIGGRTAEIVGKLLRRLGQTHQVLCITHQPQVAALGHQHIRVTKTKKEDAHYTQIQSLTQEEKINELARMLGGVEITPRVLAHAQEMLERI